MWSLRAPAKDCDITRWASSPSWRDFEKDGDWNDALYPIGNGLKQAIEKARAKRR